MLLILIAFFQFQASAIDTNSVVTTATMQQCNNIFSIASMSCSGTKPTNAAKCATDAQTCISTCSLVKLNTPTYMKAAPDTPKLQNNINLCIANAIKVGKTACSADCTTMVSKISVIMKGITPAPVIDCKACDDVGTSSVDDPATKDTPADEDKGDPAPLDPGGDTTGGTVADNTPPADETPADTPSDTTTDDPLTTASADTAQQQSMLQGLADIPIPQINFGGVNPGGRDYTTGPTVQPGSYSDVSNAVSAASMGGGFSPSGIMQNKPFVAGEVGFGKLPQAGPGGGGGGPSGGGGGMGMGGAGNGLRPNSPAQAAARRGSGPMVASVTSGFYPPGGKAPGGTTAPSAKRTTASKSKIGTSAYRNKSGSEGLALSRLFGSPRSEGTVRGGGGTYGGHSCLDTVFCSMETFFQNVDRYPNSDLKPTSK